ncbi:MAG: dihydroorotate dehydrogenase [Nitrososphaeraceae archaeon]|nr:dihydroorotate dehydrogenase [Nitrososphaeraceae archaeon]MDW0137771.1 dihydroorotate dehydrogenase [Nitrososphaeraceae archaeon]MDW0139347.1 dihydroorotate dehydrogenase [Nitrososphaeraceae archaeon]MDW0142170.1 dihydroorotate dehydrogenase [Nitrososphaeraceae archaeon]MDW0145461.1 dihydroorotate dehydrogenase [Nitrososphaeraceae archaeon]
MNTNDKNYNLSVELGKIHLRNPTMLASGILGISQSIFERLYDENIGGIVTKSISVNPMKGYPNPTVIPLGGGSYLNAVGLSNPGVNAFSKELSQNKTIPIIISLVGSSEKEFSKMVKVFDTLNILGYEINLSCPHVSKMGMEVGDDPEAVNKIVKTVRKNTTKPISVKVGVGSIDVVELARVALDAGANIITAINTLRAMSIDVETMMPILSNRIGGLSGNAIKPIGIRCVYEISKKLEAPVIGCGGVSSWKDVIEYMIAGASAVQIGSVLGSTGPRIFNQITKELKNYVEKKGLRNISEIIGIAHKY